MKEENEKKKKGKLAITVFILFFFAMVTYIAVTPFLVIDTVEKRTKLPANERLKQ
jgi:flagellar basal body-associated protein FliL